MKRIFVEMPWFTDRLKSRLDDASYRRFQGELLNNPEKGEVMPILASLVKQARQEAIAAFNRQRGVK